MMLLLWLLAAVGRPIAAVRDSKHWPTRVRWAIVAVATVAVAVMVAADPLGWMWLGHVVAGWIWLTTPDRWMW
jgi:hypothetical protein